MELITKHNLEAAAGLHTYTLGVNQFADLTNEEWRNKFLLIPNVKSMGTFEEKIGRSNRPDSIDWRDKVTYTVYVLFVFSNFI